VLKLVAHRVLTAVPTLLGVILVAMLLLELMPGDPAAIMAGDNATPEAVDTIRADLELDEPVWERFGGYVWDVVRGDLGESPGSSVPIWDRISEALPVTLSLALVAMAMAVVIGGTAGAVAALRRGRWADRAVTAAASVMQAVPAFVVGLGLVIALAVERSWFPATGYQPLAAGVGEWLRYLVLPALALALSSAAELARQTRGALVDTLEQDFIRASRAKGLSERWVVGKHAVKNAASPVVTVAGLQVARILGGAVVVEQIFGMHGFGSLAVNAVLTRDMVLIQGIVLVSAVGVLIANLVVDLSYGYLDPKVRV
jgi:peptide/nickel transport system permease protein